VDEPLITERNSDAEAICVGVGASPAPVVDEEARKSQRLLLVMCALVGIFALAEFLFAIFSGSLALLSDAFHMLSDLLGLVIAYVAVRLATRPKSEQKTYGWKRAEVIGSLMNGVFLVAVVLFIVLEAIPRFISPPGTRKVPHFCCR
jgi:cobalt-zinc-cadmium efflux system protein